MKSLLTLVLAVAWVVTPSLAQQETSEKPGAGKRPQAQPVTREQARANTYQARIEHIRKQLNLDENQTAEFDRIAAEFLAQRPSDTDRERQRELMEEMRDARKANDWKRVNELREELRGIQTGRPMAEFFDQIEKILNDEQLEKLAEIRARAAAQRGPRQGPLAQLDRLRDELKLNDDQAQRWDQLYADLQEGLGKSKADTQETSALIEEIKKAAEQGDTERIKELRAQMPDPRAESDRLTSEFFEQVERFLEPEQQETLDRFRDEMNRGRSRIAARDCLRFVSQLDLNEEQRQALREIERAARVSEREARRDPAAQEKLLKEVEEQLRGMLTDEQVAEFDRWLERQSARGPGRGHGEDRPRGERHGKRAAEQKKP
jgi:Spy/CpxP family protein refolding chaperone